MVIKEELENLIEMDGGICYGYANVDKIGWNYERKNNADYEKFYYDFEYSYGAKFILGSYAGTSCRRVNLYLRDCGSKRNELLEEYKRLLNISLDELPSFNEKLCYRWVSIPDEAINYLKQKIGLIIKIPQFWSTSNFRNEGYETNFVIGVSNDTSARYIADIVKKTEGEVLFKSGTNFIVFGFNEGDLYFKETKEPHHLVLCENFWI